MLDASTQPVMQRVRGRATVRLDAHNGRMRLRDLHQSGSAKVFLPQIHAPTPEVVFLNTSGGVTGGDKLTYELAVGDNARATGTSQTAERAYEASAGTGEINVNLSVGAGGALDWLPQETILFEKSAMSRRTNVELAADARFTMIETVVLGRKAMGETLTDIEFRDWREVRRAGTPVMIEPVYMNAEVLARGDHGALINGARAMATIALFDQGAEDAVEAVRAQLDETVVAAVSGWDGKCVVRLMAGDAWPLRQAAKKILKTVRGVDLPRVWQL